MAISWEPKQSHHFGVGRYALAVAAGIVLSFVYVFGR
jgi:hypothetical protein